MSMFAKHRATSLQAGATTLSGYFDVFVARRTINIAFFCYARRIMTRGLMIDFCSTMTGRANVRMPCFIDLNKLILLSKFNKLALAMVLVLYFIQQSRENAYTHTNVNSKLLRSCHYEYINLVSSVCLLAQDCI